MVLPQLLPDCAGDHMACRTPMRCDVPAHDEVGEGANAWCDIPSHRGPDSVEQTSVYIRRTNTNPMEGRSP
jgi:hypothetical protein